ncbi:DUF2200 domain-containing protein [Actinotalea caeni]|uniref:DUF2200 domain-containing protein n=1 Tax=Actinotalea caeni TaxID=1348467 RepID=UPI0039C865FC
MAGSARSAQMGTATERIRRMPFAAIHPMYVAKVERKGRTAAEVDEVVRWLTGYDDAGLRAAIDAGTDLETFFAEAPAINPAASSIRGTICGYKVQDIEDGLMQQIRWMDLLVDEIARGKPMEKILRSA